MTMYWQYCMAFFIVLYFIVLVILVCKQSLSDILVENAGIEKLQLNSTDLGDEVSFLCLQPKRYIYALACITKSNHHVKWNTLLLQGAKAIADLLKKNSNLRIIELNNNVIDYSV